MIRQDEFEKSVSSDDKRQPLVSPRLGKFTVVNKEYRESVKVQRPRGAQLLRQSLGLKKFDEVGKKGKSTVRESISATRIQ